MVQEKEEKTVAEAMTMMTIRRLAFVWSYTFPDRIFLQKLRAYTTTFLGANRNAAHNLFPQFLLLLQLYLFEVRFPSACLFLI